MLVLLKCNGIKMYFFLVTYLSSQNDRQTERLSGEMVNLAVILNPVRIKKIIAKEETYYCSTFSLLVYNLIVDKILGTNFHFWGFLLITHAQPLPPPQKQRWTFVSRIFAEIQLFREWGEDELQGVFHCVLRAPQN